MLLKQSERTAHIVQQQITKVAAHTVTNENSLHDKILAVGWHRIGWYLPAACAQPVGKVVQAEARIGPVLERPTDRRNTAVAVVDKAKWPHFGDFGRDMLSRLVAGVLDFPVAFKPKPEKVVVLANNLPGRTRKIQRKSRHIAAQIIDMEDQLVGQVRGVAPYHPTHTERCQAKLVT